MDLNELPISDCAPLTPLSVTILVSLASILLILKSSRYSGGFSIDLTGRVEDVRLVLLSVPMCHSFDSIYTMHNQSANDGFDHSDNAIDQS